MKRNSHILSATAALAMIAFPVLADNYQASTWLSTSSKIASEGYTGFAKSLNEASGGRLNFEVHIGGALLPAKETLQGVGRGVAQMGQVTAAYTPADLPLNNVVGDMGFTVTDGFVGAFAATDVRFNNADILAEWAGHNVVYGGSFGTSSYNFQCTSPIHGLADVQGKKVRASVGAQVDFLTSIGAVPVSVPGSDIYSGLERGSIDCTLLADDAMLGLKTVEVIKHKTGLPLGAFLGGATWGFNQDFWNDLAPADRRLILDELAIALVRTQMGLHADEGKAMAEANKRGIEMIDPDADLTAALADFMGSFVSDLPANSVEKRSIEDPTAIIQAYVAAQEKWAGLLEGVDRNDEAALVAIVQAEIYSKLDENTYAVK